MGNLSPALIPDSTYDMDLAGGLDFEIEQMAYGYTQPDRAEGLAAFREKREPDFT